QAAAAEIDGEVEGAADEVVTAELADRAHLGDDGEQAPARDGAGQIHRQLGGDEGDEGGRQPLRIDTAGGGRVAEGDQVVVFGGPLQAVGQQDVDVDTDDLDAVVLESAARIAGE